MIKALIVDDESRSRKALQQKLADYCPAVELLGEAADGENGMALINALQPDVVFLDIEMPHMNGLQMVEALGKRSCDIIFTTAYNQYAIQAFKYSAFDYLLKPVDIEELKAAVQRLEHRLADTAQPASTQRMQQVEALLQNLAGKPEQPKRIAIHTHEALHFFNPMEIIRLEANSNYTNIYFTTHPKLVASKTLKEFEDMLPVPTFFRVHHSAIINMHFVRRYIKGDGGMIEMNDGTLVDISRRKKEEFLERLQRI